MDSTKQADDWHQKGNDLFEQGKYEEAIICYDKAIEINREDLFALFSKSLALNKLGRYQEVITCFDKIIEIYPTFDMWNNKGLFLALMDKYEEAIICYDKATELNPGYAGIWYNKGKTLFRLERYEEAFTCYEKALEIDPMYANAWNNKGLVLMYFNRKKEALICYDKALEIDPAHEEAKKNKEFLLNTQDPRLFKETILNALDDIEIGPTSVEDWIERGFTLEEIREYNRAIACYDKALEIDPGNKTAQERKKTCIENVKKYN